ncbi:phage virion morphogenesis protein [Enterobacter ludwigii]|uniref:phage virion morphogenesis protein n=1 Tax=Enterobacter ludwigii TaxID=299767 RepID=UPI001D197BB2|nr:phage virion morphogenesis protein [Enterobacter ludwigii]UEG35295.1 phage virion morphogenesis protein [Enterobacter ludwigii]UEG43982.1 phage virion morphogenesis protein [Enterobacter ludwigii]
MSEFKPFDDRLNGLIAALSPAARRKLAGEIAKEQRKSQQQRIKLQKAPDGSPYQARVHQYGLKDRPNLNAQYMTYPERQLLGFAENDSQLVDILISKYIR